MSSRLQKRNRLLLQQTDPASSAAYQAMCTQAAGSRLASLRSRVEEAARARFGIIHIAERAPYGTSGYVISKDGEFLSIVSPVYGHVMPVAWRDRGEADRIATDLGGIAVYGAGLTWDGAAAVRQGEAMKFGNHGKLLKVNE